MMLDGHIHIHRADGDPRECLKRMKSVGFKGGVFIVDNARRWLKMEQASLTKLGMTNLEQDIFGRNMERFIGIARSDRTKMVLTPEE